MISYAPLRETSQMGNSQPVTQTIYICKKVLKCAAAYCIKKLFVLNIPVFICLAAIIHMFNCPELTSIYKLRKTFTVVFFILLMKQSTEFIYPGA